MTSRRYVLLALLLTSLVGCNHSSPYYGFEQWSPDLPPVPNSSDVVQRILLIGDAGEPAEGGELLLSVLADTAEALSSKTVIVFLGDNVYPRGLPVDHQAGDESERRLRAQVKAVVEGTRGIFIAGNHDWDNSGVNGLKAVREQEAYLRGYPRVELLPKAGCPGPEYIDLVGLRLILLDTQWWLHEHRRAEDCDGGSLDTGAVADSLRRLLASRGEREAVVVGHHPLETRGPHGGFYSLIALLFPAAEWKSWAWVPVQAVAGLFWWSTPGWIAAAAVSPVVYPAIRAGVIRSPQDLVGSSNKVMRGALESALASDRPLIYAAGHEHSLQVFLGGREAEYLLVSGLGSASKKTAVGHTERTLFAHATPGFMALDVLSDDRILLRVIEPGENAVVYWRWLRN